MATEFDPVTRRQIADDPTLQNVPVERDRGGVGMLGIFGALAVVLVLGLLFWNMSDGTNTAAGDTAAGVTTGSSTAPATPSKTPPPANR